MVLDEYFSSFVIYELEQGIHNFKDLVKVLFNILQPEYELFNNSVAIEFDDLTWKTILVVRPGIRAIRFDENSFFSTIFAFKPYRDYKHYNECISQIIVNLSITNKIHLKSDVIDGSVVNGFRQPIFYIFVSDKPSGYRVICELERILYKKNK